MCGTCFALYRNAAPFDYAAESESIIGIFPLSFKLVLYYLKLIFYECVRFHAMQPETLKPAVATTAEEVGTARAGTDTRIEGYAS